MLAELLLRPEEWAALDAAFQHFQKEYWRVDH
jgi:hypothetical protein